MNVALFLFLRQRAERPRGAPVNELSTSLSSPHLPGADGRSHFAHCNAPQPSDQASREACSVAAAERNSLAEPACKQPCNQFSRLSFGAILSIIARRLAFVARRQRQGHEGTPWMQSPIFSKAGRSGEFCFFCTS